MFFEILFVLENWHRRPIHDVRPIVPGRLAIPSGKPPVDPGDRSHAMPGFGPAAPLSSAGEGTKTEVVIPAALNQDMTIVVDRPANPSLASGIFHKSPRFSELIEAKSESRG